MYDSSRLGTMLSLTLLTAIIMGKRCHFYALWLSASHLAGNRNWWLLLGLYGISLKYFSYPKKKSQKIGLLILGREYVSLSEDVRDTKMETIGRSKHCHNGEIRQRLVGRLWLFEKVTIWVIVNKQKELLFVRLSLTRVKSRPHKVLISNSTHKLLLQPFRNSNPPGPRSKTTVLSS